MVIKPFLLEVTTHACLPSSKTGFKIDSPALSSDLAGSKKTKEESTRKTMIWTPTEFSGLSEAVAMADTDWQPHYFDMILQNAARHQ